MLIGTRVVSCWTVQVIGADLDWHTFALQTKDGCYLSSNTRLVGIDKAVALSCEELAKDLCIAILPIMRRRHGNDVELQVQSVRLPRNATCFDDALVLARIRDKNFAPNKRPVGLNVPAQEERALPRQYLCTLGSETCRVIPKGSAKPKTGKPFAFRLAEPKSAWQRGIVNGTNPDGSLVLTLILPDVQ